MTRSPSSIRLKSWIAFVTFLATLASRCVEYPTFNVLSRVGAAAGRHPSGRDICVSVLRDEVNHRAKKARVLRARSLWLVAGHSEERYEPGRGANGNLVEVAGGLYLAAEWYAPGQCERDGLFFVGGHVERLRFAAGRNRHTILDRTVLNLDGQSRDRFRYPFVAAQAGDRSAQDDLRFRVAFDPEPPVIRLGRCLFRVERVVIGEIREHVRSGVRGPDDPAHAVAVLRHREIVQQRELDRQPAQRTGFGVFTRAQRDVERV